MMPPIPPTASSDVGLLDVDERSTSATILRPGHGADDGPYPRGTFRRPLLGMMTLVGAIAATYLVPPLEFARPWTSEDPVLFWNILGRGWLDDEEQGSARGRERLEEAQALALANDAEPRTPIVDKTVIAVPPKEAGIPPYEAHPEDAQPIPRSLELPSPTSLDGFFARLTQSDLGFEGAITRAVHWGDSVIANDNVSSTLRESMQRRFGDSGHGFHLLAKPNASYRHKAIRFSDGEGWSRCYIINACKSDGRYGLGGTTVWSAGGARTKFGTATDEDRNGHKMSRLEVWYSSEPKSGTVRVSIDGNAQTLETAQTEGSAAVDRVAEYRVEDGAHDLEIRASGGGKVRLYGVVIERDHPGVVWDGMEQLGAFSSRMLNFDPEHLRGQLEFRDAALLVFEFGGNDLLLKASQLDRYEEQFGEMLERFRGPLASESDVDDRTACLVVSPVDHGVRNGGRIESVPMMAAITEAQRRAALAHGCAFFDTWAAMGGKNSVARWRRAAPPLVSGDLAHLTQAGQRALGTMIYLGLMEQYRAYRDRVAGQPLRELAREASPRDASPSDASPREASSSVPFPGDPGDPPPRRED